jgi:hypothetical protein
VTEPIHARLDREVSRLRTERDAGDTRISESYINGIEHAATIAYRAEQPASDAGPAEPDAASEAPVTMTAEYLAYLMKFARVGVNSLPETPRNLRHRHLDTIEKAARESNDLAAQLKTLAKETR